MGSADQGAVVAGGTSIVGPDGVPGRGMPEHRPFRSHGVLSVLHAPDSAGDEQGRDRRCRMPARRTRGPVGARCRDAGACRRCDTRCCASRTPRSSACGDHRCRWSSSWPTRECDPCRRCPHARWRRALGPPMARAATATPTTSAGGQRWPPTPEVDPHRWRARESAVAEPGQVNLRALPVLVVVEVLFGVQQRVRGGAKITDAQLRVLCDGLRPRQVASITTDRAEITRNKIRAVPADRTDSTRPAGSGRPRERTGQGHLGSRGLRPSREPVVHRNQPALAGPVRQTVGSRTTPASSRPRRCESARQDQRAAAAVGVPRPQARSWTRRFGVGPQRHRGLPQPAGPPGVDRRDQPIPAQLHLPRRARGAGRHPRPRPDQAGTDSGGLAGDFAIERRDIPAEPERGEPGRDVPPEVMAILCANLDTLEPVEVRVATQIGIDTGRRPEDILALPVELLGPRQGRSRGPRLRQRQGPPPRSALADRRSHRQSDHRPAAAGPRDVPRHPSR